MTIHTAAAGTAAGTAAAGTSTSTTTSTSTSTTSSTGIAKNSGHQHPKRKDDGTLPFKGGRGNVHNNNNGNTAHATNSQIPKDGSRNTNLQNSSSSNSSNSSSSIAQQNNTSTSHGTTNNNRIATKPQPSRNNKNDNKRSNFISSNRNKLSSSSSSSLSPLLKKSTSKHHDNNRLLLLLPKEDVTPVVEAHAILEKNDDGIIFNKCSPWNENQEYTRKNLENNSINQDNPDVKRLHRSSSSSSRSRSRSSSDSKHDCCWSSSSYRKNHASLAMSQTAAAAATAAANSRDESKLQKIFIRLFFGILMVVIFLSHLYMGHVYLCGLIFFTEVMLFRELVKVRYNTFFYIIEETIPLFRTTQWLWFWTAIFYTYSDFVVEVIKGNTSLHYLLDYARFQTGFSFLLYSGTFVLTIATIQPGYIRFQLNQLCWTILVLCLTVGQLKYIMHNVYNGLFWFTLPIMLVVSNDSFAWLAGITCGRKFIQREFISISPNKTWEGFIGGWIGTMIFGWHLARFMAKYTWMICPETTFSLLPGTLECEPNHVFQPATNIFPSQVFELIPSGIAQMIPGVVDICMVDGNATNLTACVSGEDRHTHHHFELVLKELYPVQIHALGLSLFASFVAPFGGFLASAIKRAYGLKDFASFIPGHGGMMDRMDCQLLMALCTWVHYNTFVNMTTVSVPKMIYMYKLMKESEQEEFLKRISEL